MSFRESFSMQKYLSKGLWDSFYFQLTKKLIYFPLMLLFL